MKRGGGGGGAKSQNFRGDLAPGGPNHLGSRPGGSKSRGGEIPATPGDM